MEVNKIGIVLVIAMLAMQCGNKKPDAGAQVHKTAVVTYHDLRDVMSRTGELEPLKKIELKSEASGKIERLYVREGEQVDSGSLIAVIDPQQLTIDKRRLDLLVQQALLNLEEKQRDVQQAKRLQSTGSVAQNKLDDLIRSQKRAQIELDLRKLELHDVEYQLRRTKIRAPISGVLTELNVEEGEIVTSATDSYQGGTAIGTIANIDKLEVVSTIGEVDYVHLKKGQPVIVKPAALQNKSTTGTISFLALSAKKVQERELSEFTVRIELDSLIEGLVPGVSVSVDFIILEADSVLSVPSWFVTSNNNTHTVQRKTPDGGVTPVEVTIGRTDYQHTEIVSGVSVGDTLLMSSGPAGAKGPR